MVRIRAHDSDYHYGIYHLVNEPETTWFNFATSIIITKYGSLQKRIIPVSSDEFPLPAKRPHYSILLNAKGPTMRPWREALQEYI